MFETNIYEEEPALEIGQFYPNNYLMQSYLTLDVIVNLYVTIGKFTS
jgi:hypothetical protein